MAGDWATEPLRLAAVVRKTISSMSMMFKFFKVLSIVVIALLAFSMAAFGVLVWRLSDGPVSLEFAHSYIDSVVTDRLGDGATLSHGTAQLSSDGQGRFFITVPDMALQAKNADLKVADTQLYYSARQFLRGEIYPQAVEIEDFSLEIRQDKTAADDDPFAIFKTEGRLEYPSVLLSKFEEALSSVIFDVSANGFETLKVTNGTVTIFNEQGESTANLRSVELHSRIRGEGREGDTVVSFDRGYGPVTARLHHGRNGSERFLRINVDTISLAEFVPNLRRHEGQGAQQLLDNVPFLFGYIDFRRSENGRVFLSVSADMTAGYFWLGKDGIILLDEANAQLVWDNERRGFTVDNLSASAGLTNIVLGGAVKWPERPRVGISYYLHDQGSQVGGGSSWRGERTIPFRDMIVAGQIAQDFSILTAEQFNIFLPRGRIIGTGSIDRTVEDPVLGFASDIKDLPLSTALTLWPSVISPNLRRWVSSQVKGGMVENALVSAAIPFSSMKPVNGRVLLPENAIESDVTLTNVALVPFGGLPVVAGITANIKSTGRTVDVRGSGGWYDSEAGRVDILEGTYRVGDMWQHPMQAKLELVGAGSVEAVAEILDANPLNLVEKQNYKTSDLDGSFSGTLVSSFPLKPNLTDREFQYVFEGRLEKFSSDKPINGRTITDGGLTLNVDNSKAVITGSAKLDGVSAKVDFTQRFDEPDSADTGVSMVLGDEERLKLGIDLTGFVSGQVEVQTENTDDPNRVRITMDLTDARLNVDAMNWSKGAGIKASAKFEVVTEQDSTLIDNFELKGEDFFASGTLRLASDGRFIRARLDRIELRKNDRISAVISAIEGGYEAVVTGSFVDARPMIDALGETGQTDDVTVFDINIDRVMGHNGVAFNALSVKGRQEGNFPAFIEGSAVLDGGVGVTMITEGAGRSRSLRAKTLDGGAVLRFMNIYKYAFGGAMDYKSTWNELIEGEASEFLMTDFRVIDEPALERLTAADPVEPDDRDRGRFVRSKNAQGRGTRFTRAQGDFQRVGAQIRLSRFNVYGPELGVTVRGEANFDNRRVDISGTYIPAYRLNSFFSRVPILGNALSLRRSEGILGVTFRVSGTIESPVLSINPLSAIAPGIFRGFFEYR